MIVTYLLTLRNDVSSKNRVETLEPAVDLRLEFKSEPTASSWSQAMDAHYHNMELEWFPDEDEYLEFEPSEVEGWDEEEVDENDDEPVYAGWTESMIDEFIENMYKNDG